MYKIMFLVFYVISISESKNILAVFPTPSVSHQVVFRPLMLELARRGHEVTVITTNPIFPRGGAPKNFTEIDVHDISYNIWTEFVEAGKGKANDLAEQMKLAYDLLRVIFEAQVNSPEVQTLISDKKKKFDLVFSEHCVRLALSFSYLYDAPVIEFSSLGGLIGGYESMGAASHPLVYPSAFQQHFYKATTWDKISEFHLYYSFLKFYSELEILENKLLKKLFGLKAPTLGELKERVDMLFVNLRPIWDLNRPVPPNVLYLGGLHQIPPKGLPEDLSSYLDSSKNGVIYISFGTNVKPSLLPAEKLKIFKEVFSELPYDVLWKWDSETFLDCPKNVKFAKWLPQPDLLKHKKIKLFITQGGLQSTDEAIAAGVPLIGVPMLADQWYNAEQYVIHKIGIKLDLETFTGEDLKHAIYTIINNSSYRDNVIKLHKIMDDQPLSPLERAVWWTEHVLRHKGASHLKANGAHMHWTEYYEIKLIMLLVIVSTLLLLILGLAIYYVGKKITSCKLKIKVN